MNWQLILIIVIGLPLILFPVAYVWYLNLGGLYAWIRKVREEKDPAQAKVERKAAARTSKYGTTFRAHREDR